MFFSIHSRCDSKMIFELAAKVGGGVESKDLRNKVNFVFCVFQQMGSFFQAVRNQIIYGGNCQNFGKNVQSGIFTDIYRRFVVSLPEGKLILSKNVFELCEILQGKSP